MNKLYNSLLTEIAKAPKLAEGITKKRETLRIFVEYLRANESQVAKFGRVTQEVSSYLDNYEFSKACSFDSMRKKIAQIPPFRLKLVKIGEEAKKLIGYPDRYNSKQSIETCKALVLACQSKMSLDEIPKVSELIDNNIKRLIQIQGLLAADANELTQIQALVHANLSLLQRFVAFKKELDQYITNFPQGNDLKVVQERISALQQLSVLWDDVEKVIKLIRGNAERYNKDALVKKYDQVIVNMQSNMCWNNLMDVKNELHKIQAQAKSINALYQADANELTQIQALVHANLSLLQRFVAFKKELDQYIANFPQGNDLKVVQERISRLQQLSSLWDDVEKVIKLIRNNADRYNKDALVRKYAQLVVNMQSNMCWNNLMDVKNELHKIQAQATSINALYQAEVSKLKKLQQDLQQKKNMMWREDHQKLVTQVNSLLGKDSAKVSYDINQLNESCELAVRKKNDLIRMTLEKYRWLNSGSYREQHDAFAYNSVTSFEYTEEVSSIKKKRTIKLLCIYMPIIGCIILLIIGCIFLLLT